MPFNKIEIKKLLLLSSGSGAQAKLDLFLQPVTICIEDKPLQKKKPLS